MSNIQQLVEAAENGAVAAARAVLEANPELVHARDERGATALHYAASGGHRELVEELVRRGADINARDAKFNATPAGWAIEYMRDMGAFLGTELSDFAYAIERGDVDWVERLLTRWPGLRDAKDARGRTFRESAEASQNTNVAALFK